MTTIRHTSNIIGSSKVTSGNVANPWLARTAVIEVIQPEIESVVTYEMRFVDSNTADHYRFLPGQFNMLYIPGCGETAISMSGSPRLDGSRIVHTIRFVGRVTEAISQLSVGDSLGIRGPFGTAWPIERCKGRDIVVIAGGIGLAPLRPAIYSFIENRHDFGRIVLLYGSRSPELLLFDDELESWREHGIEIQVTVDRAPPDWQGAVGVVPLLLDRLPGLKSDRTEVMMCGPEVMMHYCALSALKRNIPKQSIWLSIERNMQCAVGLCGHCQLGSVFVCRQGPVFSYDIIERLLKVRDF
jgi:NAD(P)H-flavin reductase